MARFEEDHKTHLHRVASSNLPLTPRKSWEYYVAILQPGIPLEKCEHEDFLWMKVKETVTIEKVLLMHLKRTGRNSVLMDGDIGLTIATKMTDIRSLGLGVLVFWEIVKVERWWEYTVQSTVINEQSRMVGKQESNPHLVRSTSTKVYQESGPMRDEKLEWGMRVEPQSKSEAVGVGRSEIFKRKKNESEDETDEVVKRRRKKLDNKVEIMRLKNQNPPPIDALEKLAENTNIELRRHDEYVEKKRCNISMNVERLGGGYKEMLQRFEISWERQRQDIINSDPQFRRGQGRWPTP